MELQSEPGSVGEHLTMKGGEFGTTTGRQRRCGCYDDVIIRYAVQANGLTDLLITKPDVLSELDTSRESEWPCARRSHLRTIASSRLGPTAMIKTGTSARVAGSMSQRPEGVGFGWARADSEWG
jgi:hypothetical protein